MDNTKHNICINVNNNRTLPCRYGDNLFDVLSDNGYIFSGNCGGLGACRRCQVEIEGVGLVKSCEYVVTSDLQVSFPEDNTQILAEYSGDVQGCGDRSDDGLTGAYDSSFGIAVDLGTTTVAMELVAIPEGSELGRYGFLNPQIAYGSDVVSRIKKGSDHQGLSEMRDAVISKISEGIGNLSKNSPEVNISEIVISCNTTMSAILENLTLENLGAAPFLIKNPDVVAMDGSVFFGDDNYKKVSVTCLPNLSAFVGSDALCGALVCDLDTSDSYRLFADLGTNGEIILAKNGVGYATSCACGPAFERMLKRGTAAASTAFDILDRLKAMKIVDESGVLSDAYIEKGYRLADGTVIEMDMIRSFLLAKAAICAGIESLVRKAGITFKDISKVYIAGGFGCSLRISSAVNLGLFPSCFQDKTAFVGNSSLNGAHKCLIDRTFIDRIYAFKGTLTAVNLGETEDFEKNYYSHMNLSSWDKAF